MYNKLFSKIVDSSIWMEPDHVRLIWLMFIAVMDEDGFVKLASVKNVAQRAVMDLEKATDALKVLESPDPESSNPANEGRRIQRVPGGWMVLNAKEYREIVKREHEKELNRERVRKYRGKFGCNGDVMGGNETVTISDTYTDTEAESNTKTKKRIYGFGYSESFEEFWAAFPPGRKQDKAKASKAWNEAIKSADAETIIQAAKEYAASDVGRGEFVKGPAPWLNGRCWEDDRAAWMSKDKAATRNVGAKYDPNVTTEQILEGFR